MQEGMFAAAGPADGPLTLAEYDALEEGPYRLELSRGWLVSEPGPGPVHGHLHSWIAHLLIDRLQRPGAGVVLTATAFLLADVPPTVRIPDIAVLRGGAPVEGYPSGPLRGAPDLAIEINSPSNSASDNLARVRDYFDAGTPVLWIVDPPTRTVTAHTSASEAKILRAADPLPGGPAFPALRVSVDEVFTIERG